MPVTRNALRNRDLSEVHETLCLPRILHVGMRLCEQPHRFRFRISIHLWDARKASRLPRTLGIRTRGGGMGWEINLMVRLRKNIFAYRRSAHEMCTMFAALVRMYGGVHICTL